MTDLLPVHEQAWLNAMGKYITDRFEASDAAGEFGIGIA